MTVAELTTKGKKAALKKRSAMPGPSRRKHGTPAVLAAELWLLVALTGMGATEVAPRRVLILESLGHDFMPWNAIAQTFKTDLTGEAPWPIEFHEASLETARLDDPPAEEAFVAYLRAQHARRPPDLVAAVGAPAAQFWSRRRADLFPAAPVVVGIDRFLLHTVALTSNDAVACVEINMNAIVEIVGRLFPARTNLAVVFGQSPVERYWADACRQVWQPLTHRFHFAWLNELPFPDLCRRVADLPPGWAVGYGSLMVDAAGVPYGRFETLDRICAVANAPVFGITEEELGHGIIGGWLISGADQGREMARMAAAILRGESPARLPPSRLTATPMFDWRQLRRWRVDERRLPPGSVVRFREPSAWERYRWYIVGTLVLLIAESIVIAALLLYRTQRRRAEAQLRESERFMDLATSASEIGLWVRDGPTGVLRTNARFRAIFGFTDDRAIEIRDVIERLHPEDRPRIEARLRQGLEEGRPFELEGRLLLPDGKERWISVMGMAVLDDRGHPLRTEGVVLDRTARQVAEMRSKQHRDQLAHVGRVHALGQLSSALAHELNQPLSAIVSNAQAAQRFLGGNAPDLEEIRGALQDIVADGNRASEVIRGMRALVQRHRLELSPLDLDGVIRDVAALLHSDAVIRRVTVTLDLDPALHPVRGDRIQLQQVVLNLVLNALDAMKDAADGDRVVTLRALNVNSQAVRMAVVDRGTGISRDKLDKLFEPFRTTKPQGLGLGLTISRSIIEAHGGRLWGENNADRGATFYFELPVAGKSNP